MVAREEPLKPGDTVRVENRVGKLESYDGSRWIVLFEDGSRVPCPETLLKPIQILRG